MLSHLKLNFLRRHFDISCWNETSYKQFADWNYCGCILIDKAIISLHEGLYRYKIIGNKTFAPRKKNAWRMSILFISHNLWFYFLPPIWFGSSASWQDTLFEWQVPLSVSYLYRKVPIIIHETISTCVMCGREACLSQWGKNSDWGCLKNFLLRKFGRPKEDITTGEHCLRRRFIIGTFRQTIIKAIRSAEWNGMEM